MTGFDIQCTGRCFPVEFTGTSVSPNEAKMCDFGSVVDRSMIRHFRLKINCLTKPAGSYKQSYNLNLFIKKQDIKWLYWKHVYINMEISILHKANSLQVTEMTTCLRVSHGKALPSILEIAPNFGHDTNALTVFRSSCTTRITSCATGSV